MSLNQNTVSPVQKAGLFSKLAELFTPKPIAAEEKQQDVVEEIEQETMTAEEVETYVNEQLRLARGQSKGGFCGC